MFFGNFRQTWSEFVLADLGIFRYESVSLDESARAFQTREQIEQFHALYRCRELVHAEAPLEEVLAALPPPMEGSAWIEAKRSWDAFWMRRSDALVEYLAEAAAIQSEPVPPSSGSAKLGSIRPKSLNQVWDIHSPITFWPSAMWKRAHG